MASKFWPQNFFHLRFILLLFLLLREKFSRVSIISSLFFEALVYYIFWNDKNIINLLIWECFSNFQYNVDVSKFIFKYSIAFVIHIMSKLIGLTIFNHLHCSFFHIISLYLLNNNNDYINAMISQFQIKKLRIIFMSFKKINSNITA